MTHSAGSIFYAFPTVRVCMWIVTFVSEAMETTYPKNSSILFAFHTFVSPLSLVFGRLHRKICRNGILLWMWVNFFSQHIKWSWTFIISGWLSMLFRNHFIYINVCPAYSPIIHSKQNSPEHIVWSIFNFILAHTHGKFWTLFHTFRSHELSIATDTLSYQSQF